MIEGSICGLKKASRARFANVGVDAKQMQSGGLSRTGEEVVLYSMKDVPGDVIPPSHLHPDLVWRLYFYHRPSGFCH